MRKILSLVLVLALVLGAFPAFADVDQYEVANKLKEYKVLVGNEAGDLMLDEYLTREQAMVVLSRLMGVEEDAKGTTLQSSFTDVDHPYYEPFIAYAELKGWTNGIGNGLFGYGQELKVQEFAAYMLRVLGHEVEYEKVMDTAKDLGLLNDVVNTDPAASILRGETAVMMNNALMAKPVNSEMTLLQVLGLEGETETAVAMVKSVEATNLKQLVVHFTAPLTEAGDEKNYDLKTKGTAKIDKNSDFELSEDGKTVTITLTDAAEQQEEVDLKIEDLLQDDITVEDIQFLDVTIPEAKSAAVIGVDTLKVEFSEPMKKASLEKTKNFTVEDAKGGKMYVKSVQVKENNTVAWVELYSDLKQGDITLEVDSAEDFQGYAVKPAEFTLTVVEDKEAPTIVDYKDAEPYEITLIWSEDIEFVETSATKITAGEELEKFYHTNTRDYAKSVEIDGNEMTLKFDKDDGMDTRLPEGTAYVYVKKEAVRDLWENENAKQVLTAEVVADVDAPEIKELEVTEQDEVEVEFNEDVFENDDFDWELIQDGKVENIDADIDGWGTDTLTLVFSEDIEGDYTLVFKNLEDKAENEAKKLSIDFTADDEKQPNAEDFKVTAYDIDNKVQKIVVNFDEAMDVASITDKDDFFLTTIAGDDYVLKETLDDDDVDFTVEDGDEVLVIEIPADYHDLKADDLGFLKIGRLVDAAGNKMTTYSANLPIANGDELALPHKAELVSDDEIEITIEDEVVEDIHSKKFKFYDEAGAELDLARFSLKLDDGDTIITAELGKEVNTDAKLTYSVMAGAGENQYGAKLEVVTNKAVLDDAGPEMEKVTTENGMIVIEMSEALSAKYESSIPQDLVVKYNGETLKPVKEYTAKVEGNKVYLSGVAGKEDTIHPGKGKYRVKSVDKPLYLVDVALNKAENFTDYEKINKVAPLDGTTPDPNPNPDPDPNPNPDPDPNPNPDPETDVYTGTVKPLKLGFCELTINRTVVGTPDVATVKFVAYNAAGEVVTPLVGKEFNTPVTAFPEVKAGDKVDVKLFDATDNEVGTVQVELTAAE